MMEFLHSAILLAFVLFMVWIVVGYHRQRDHHKRGEER